VFFVKRRSPRMPVAEIRHRPDIHSDRLARDFMVTVWHECAHIVGLYAVLCGTPLPHFADAGLKG